MFYTIYKITNLINSKIYIGCHKTNNLDDGYMGSGKILKRAQEKYGIENFEKEILEVFDNPSQMFEMESLLVNGKFIQSENTYNLKEGGSGGFEYINQNGLNIYKTSDGMILNGQNAYKNLEKIINSFGSIIDYLKDKGEMEYKIYIEKVIKGKKEKSILLYGNESEIFKTFTGKKHTEESKKKIGEKNSLKQSGEGNSQFGTMWIHNLKLKESKKIKKDDFPKWQSEGWFEGRKMKFF